ETLEPVPDGFEVGPHVDDVVGMMLRPEAIGDPDLLALDVVGCQISPHVDRATTAAGPALDEITDDPFVAHGVEMRVQLLEASASHHRVGEVVAFVPDAGRR